MLAKLSYFLKLQGSFRLVVVHLTADVIQNGYEKILNCSVVFFLLCLVGSCWQGRHISPDLMERIKYLSNTIYSLGSLNSEASPYIHEGLDICERLSSEVDLCKVKCDISPILAIYNNGAIGIAFSEMDYDEAIRLLKSGISYAGDEKYIPYFSSMSYNLVLAYYIRRDTSGLKYAERLYNVGVESGNDNVELMGLYSLAMMYDVSGNYQKALECIERVTEADYSELSFLGVDALHANILYACGRGDEAETYFKSALANVNDELPIISAYTYMSYGDYLKDKGEYLTAIDMLEKGLEKSAEAGDRMYDFMLYRSMSETYEKLGKYQDALEYFKRYKNEADNVFNIERERAVSELNLKYEEERHKSEMQKRASVIVTISLVLSAMSVIVIILVVMYRSKNRMYLKIVRHYKELMSIKEDMERRKESSSAGDDAPHDDAVQQERLDTLFRSLENMMTEQQVFRNPGITRDSIAEALGTNRTYLSKAVNEHRKQNFSQYVNAYRIAYALKRLSDPEKEVSLKEIAIDAGFSSFTTFARQFKSEVGMPPSVYREKVIELDKKMG